MADHTYSLSKDSKVKCVLYSCLKRAKKSTHSKDETDPMIKYDWHLRNLF